MRLKSGIACRDFASDTCLLHRANDLANVAQLEGCFVATESLRDLVGQDQADHQELYLGDRVLYPEVLQLSFVFHRSCLWLMKLSAKIRVYLLDQPVSNVVRQRSKSYALLSV